MLRRIGISLLLLVLLVVMIPVITSTAHNLRAHFSSHSRNRRHSRAWWRRHRAQMRRRQAMLARRRAMIAARRAGQIPSVPAKTAENHAVLSTAVTITPNPATREAMALPNGWSQASNTNGAANFRIAPANGSEAQATLAVVAPSTGAQPFGREQRNMVGGASFTELRRSVIDRMVSAGGWVVNDRQRQIGGRRVFEVVAQTPSTNGKPDQVWNFYFTEVNGRVYSLTTRSTGANDKIVSDAEKFIGGFTPADTAQNKRK